MKFFTRTLVLILLAGSFQKSLASCSLPVPTGFKLKNQTSCSVDVSWKKVTGVSYYIVEYKLSSSGTWIMSGNISTTFTTISGLSSNMSYDFAVASFCTDNTTVGFSSSLSKTTKKCSTPINLTATSVNSTSATINWTPLCGSSNFTLNYRIQGTSMWTKISNILTSSYALTNLQSVTTYEYQVQTNCGGSRSSWSSIFTFTTLSTNPPKKNILLIVLDDARYDAFIPNGAPSWFNTPSINSIASQGVNFKYTIPTTSQCSPSRACMYTGVYPHINGVERNGDTLNASFPIIQQILKDHGYYTGFIGKYGQFLGDPKGFSWWATSDGDVFIDPPYKMNGVDTSFSGHISDVYPQLAKTFLNTVPANQNFMLCYFTRVPHYPTTPRPQDTLLYVNQTMPFPSNFPFYTTNYPSFYTDEEWNADTAKVNALKLATYQCNKGADDNVDSIFAWIIQKYGTLDSTLILFTSDNGFLMGEHHLHEKILGLEESIRVPLFIRYPKWFAANSLVTDEFASNLDFATTILDFTGLPNTYGFQGLSLRQLYNGQVQRKNFLYETGWDPYVPRLRAVRTLSDIYIRSYCKTTTEEYYDLVADPLNNTNQIFNSSFSSTISAHQALLDSLRGVYNDVDPKKKVCNMVTGGRMEIYNHDEAPEIQMAIGPNPAAGTFSIYFTSHQKFPAAISVSDELGNLLWHQSYSIPLDVLEEIDCSNWSNGFYFVKAEQNGKVYGGKVLVQQ